MNLDISKAPESAEKKKEIYTDIIMLIENLLRFFFCITESLRVNINVSVDDSALVEALNVSC